MRLELNHYYTILFHDGGGYIIWVNADNRAEVKAMIATNNCHIRLSSTDEKEYCFMIMNNGSRDCIGADFRHFLNWKRKRELCSHG